MATSKLSEDKMRIQVICSNELVERLDKYAQMMGVTRSALACMFIGQGIMGFDKAMNVVDKLGDGLLNSFQDMLSAENRGDSSPSGGLSASDD